MAPASTRPTQDRSFDQNRWANSGNSHTGAYGFTNRQTFQRSYPHGYSPRNYGYTGYQAYTPNTGTKVAMAAAGGFAVGAAGGYIASRYYTYGMGDPRHHYSRGGCAYCGSSCSYGSSWTGSCEACYQQNRNDPSGCKTEYNPKKSANRDDLMKTGFIPADFKGPIKVKITQVSGDEFDKSKVCPPAGYTGDCPELEKLSTPVRACSDFNQSWSCEDLSAARACTSLGALSTCNELRNLMHCFDKLWTPIEQDIFLTFTKTDMLKDESSSTAWVWWLIGSILTCCCCCGCGYYWYKQDEERNSARTFSVNEAELQAYPSPAQPWQWSAQHSATPMVQATPVAAQPGPVGYVQQGVAYGSAQATTVAEPPPPPSVRMCHQSHPLGSYRHSYAEAAECDRCAGRIFPGHTAYGCRTCDYDLCQECYNLDTFLDFPAYRGGATWRQELDPYPPIPMQDLDPTSPPILAPPWSDAMLHAVAWELNNPQWPSDPRFTGERNGPAGQIIDFVIGKGFGHLQPVADNTEQWAKDATGLSEIQRMYEAGYQPQTHQLPVDPVQLRRMLGHNGLKQELQQRGLKDTGKTEDLAKRLSEALVKERQ